MVFKGSPSLKFGSGGGLVTQLSADNHLGPEGLVPPIHFNFELRKYKGLGSFMVLFTIINDEIPNHKFPTDAPFIRKHIV